MSGRPIGVTGATGGLGGRVAAAPRRPRRAAAPARARRRPRAGPGARRGRDVRRLRRRRGRPPRAGGRRDPVPRLGRRGPRPRRAAPPAVDAAVAAGVGRIVYTSFVGAAPDCTFTFGRDHFHTEEHIRASGVGHTFLRDNLYLDFIPGLSPPDGVIRGPAGDGRVAAVARDDIADVAVRSSWARATTGRRTTSPARRRSPSPRRRRAVARVGPAITFEDETLEEARESRRPSGAADFEIEGWVTSYAAIARGRPRSGQRLRAALPRPPAEASRGVAAREPRELPAPPAPGGVARRPQASTRPARVAQSCYLDGAVGPSAAPGAETLGVAPGGSPNWRRYSRLNCEALS